MNKEDYVTDELCGSSSVKKPDSKCSDGSDKNIQQSSPPKHEYRGAFNGALVDLLPVSAEKLLDVGCSDGCLGEYLLHEKLAKEVVGLEINSATAEAASKKLTKVYCGNAEELELPYPEEYFDCLIYGDSLEHMREPGKLLVKHLRYLKKGGYIVCSIPNIRNLFIIQHLINGNWTYTDWGIVDYTHLRFFTLREIIKMISGAGLIIEVINPSLRDGEWFTKMYDPKQIDLEFIKVYNGLLQLCIKGENISPLLKKFFPFTNFSQEDAVQLFAAQFHIRARKNK